jgi:prolyl oligopeptidase
MCDHRLNCRLPTVCSVIVAAAFLGQDEAALAQSTQPPAPAPSGFSETLYGTVVPDPYHSFEPLDDKTLAWIKREGDFTRATFDSIPARGALLHRLSAFEAEFTAVTGYQATGSRAFFLRRDAGADDLNLIERDGGAERKIVDIAAMRAADHGAPYAINFFLASPDGSKVAVGISKGGSEDAVLRVYDTRTGNPMGGSADRAQLGLLAWSDDSARLYFNRLRALAPGQKQTDRYRYATIEQWDLNSEPATFFDPRGSTPAALGPTDIPSLLLSRGSPVAALSFENGADPNLAVWIAPKSELSATSAWRPLVSHADGVTALQISGANIFLLSDAGAELQGLGADGRRAALGCADHSPSAARPGHRVYPRGRRRALCRGAARPLRDPVADRPRRRGARHPFARPRPGERGLHRPGPGWRDNSVHELDRARAGVRL